MRIRRTRIGAVVLVALVFAGLAAITTDRAESGNFKLSGRVLGIRGGDALRVRLADRRTVTVRLIGIRAPSRRACYGLASRRALRKLAVGKRVTLVGDPTQRTRDRAGRMLAYVVLRRGGDLGRQLVSAGLARVSLASPFRRRPAFRRLKIYSRAQSASKASQRGLWSCTARADLTLTNEFSPNALNAGGQATYTVTVANRGPTKALAVRLSATLPAEGRPNAPRTPSGATCTEAARVYTCRLAALAAGESASFSFPITFPQSGRAVAQASVTSRTRDPERNDNSATATAVVRTPPPPLRLEARSSPP